MTDEQRAIEALEAEGAIVTDNGDGTYELLTEDQYRMTLSAAELVWTNEDGADRCR